MQVAFIAMLGSVTLEVCLTARYWTWFFGVIVFLSYWLVYPFELLFPVVEMWIKSPDPAQYGVARHIFSHPQFWLIIILTNSITFGHRYVPACSTLLCLALQVSFCLKTLTLGAQ